MPWDSPENYTTLMVGSVLSEGCGSQVRKVHFTAKCEQARRSPLAIAGRLNDANAGCCASCGVQDDAGG